MDSIDNWIWPKVDSVYQGGGAWKYVVYQTSDIETVEIVSTRFNCNLSLMMMMQLRHLIKIRRLQHLPTETTTVMESLLLAQFVVNGFSFPPFNGLSSLTQICIECINVSVISIE